MNSLESFKGRGGGGGRRGAPHSPQSETLSDRRYVSFDPSRGRSCHVGDPIQGCLVIPPPPILGWLNVKISGGCILSFFAVLKVLSSFVRPAPMNVNSVTMSYFPCIPTVFFFNVRYPASGGAGARSQQRYHRAAGQLSYSQLPIRVPVH